MANKTYKLGELIELSDERNSELKFGADDVRGMTIEKTVIPTKANMDGTDLANFIIVQPNEFIYNPRTHGKRIGLGFNDTDKPFLISWNNYAFRIKESAKKIINARYLFMNYNRPEWDRRACRDSWGTSTEVFSWDSMCDMEITLPDLKIQEKYVEIYETLVENQKSYERGLDDLKLTCDAYIEELQRKMPCEKIGKYINEVNVKNIENKFGIESIRGISIKKEFTDTKADTNDLSTTNYKIVCNDQFAFNPNTARMGEKICVAYNNSEENYLVSAIYPVFEVIQKNILCAEYLMMFFLRSEFDRYVRFNSWGSARETFDFPDMCEVMIPIPPMEIQHSIVDVFKVYNERKTINEKLKLQIKDICPILIKGSLEDAKEA